MKQGQELWYDTLYLIGHEHLVAVELNLVLLQFQRVLDAWEVKNTRKVKWIVHVQVNPEQRFIVHGVEGTVERLVVLILQRRGSLRPQRLHIINNIILGCLYLFAVFPLSLLTKSHGNGQELAILVQQSLKLELIEEFLGVIIDIEDDVRTVSLALSIINLIGWRTVAAPFHGL